MLSSWSIMTRLRTARLYDCSLYRTRGSLVVVPLSVVDSFPREISVSKSRKQTILHSWLPLRSLLSESSEDCLLRGHRSSSTCVSAQRLNLPARWQGLCRTSLPISKRARESEALQNTMTLSMICKISFGVQFWTTRITDLSNTLASKRVPTGMNVRASLTPLSKLLFFEIETEPRALNSWLAYCAKYCR